MADFKTKMGTVLPLVSLKGKDYLQVAYRVVWFREEHPLGRFDVECMESTEKHVLYKATVSIPDDKGSYLKLADGFKREDFAHFMDAHEKASTGAIGRALALIGYGTQFTDELEEKSRIVDSPVARPAPAPAQTSRAAPPQTGPRGENPPAQGALGPILTKMRTPGAMPTRS